MKKWSINWSFSDEEEDCFFDTREEMEAYCCIDEEDDDCFFDAREEMESYSTSIDDEDDELFFDTREEMECCSHGNDEEDDCSMQDTVDFDSSFSDSRSRSNAGSGYEIWMQNLDVHSVRERRENFFQLIGLDSMEGDCAAAASHIGEELGDHSCLIDGVHVDRMVECSGAVSRDSCFIDGESCNCSSDDIVHAQSNSQFTIKNSNDGTDQFVVHELLHVSSNRLHTPAESQRGDLGISPLVERTRGGNDNSDESVGAKMKRKKTGWLDKLGAVACNVGYRLKSEFPRAKVGSIKKSQKYLSRKYAGKENIDAHVGSILTMKFSVDGKLLASAGEDGVVRVWKVMESKHNEHHIPLTPLFSDQDKFCNGRRTKRKALPACSILPPTVFRLSDKKPVHEFRGHCGNVLNLSWSGNQYLLSSSEDKTVRLWKIGCDHCLRVFPHNNYVTSVQFNPINDKYFISGSIDGKVRIWDIKGVKVVGWTDVMDIVTAVCYQPDGRGVVVGSMSGNCRFYSISDNRLILDAEISDLRRKKKSPASSRITCIKYSPTDGDKIIVTSADSKIRTLERHEVVSKYIGLGKSPVWNFCIFHL